MQNEECGMQNYIVSQLVQSQRRAAFHYKMSVRNKTKYSFHHVPLFIVAKTSEKQV